MSLGEQFPYRPPLYLPDVPDMIGSETPKAGMMRVLRVKRKSNGDGNNVTGCYQEEVTDVTTKEHQPVTSLLPRDRDKDITNSSSSNHDNVFQIWNNEFFPPIREILKDEILDLIAEYGEPKAIYAI